MRRHLLLLGGVTFLLLLFFEQWIGVVSMVASIPRWWECAMNWLTKFEIYLIRTDLHPLALSLLLALFISGWIVPDGWPLIRRHFLKKIRREFRAEFDAPDNQDARDSFSSLLIKAYGRYGSEPKMRLPDVLDSLAFPPDFPPTIGSLTNYTYDLNWPNAASQDFWYFMVALTSDVYSGHDGGILSPAEAEVFRRSRRVAAKFWDKWALEIKSGDIPYNDLHSEIFANRRAISALAVAELAYAEVASLDQGPGKTGLFELAIRPANLGPAPWWKRIFGKPRRSLAASI